MMNSKTANCNIGKSLEEMLEKLRPKPVTILRIKDIEISEFFMGEENDKEK